MKQPKEKLKTYFNTGDKPTEQQFCDLIDSYHHIDSGLIVTNVATNTDGDQKITFSNGVSIEVKNPEIDVIVNNTVRVVDLGILSPFGDEDGPSTRVEAVSKAETLKRIPVKPVDAVKNNSFIEKLVVQAINRLDPPLVVNDNENIIFEFDVATGPIVIGEGPIS